VQRDLQGSGYELLTAAGPREAAEQLARRAPRLILVTGLAHRIGDASPTQPAGAQEDIYALCRAIKAAAQPAGGPAVLLLASVWAEDVLARGLDAGADYFIFAPYQPQDLLRSIRNVLLNGPSKEATEAGEQGPAPVTVIYQDRLLHVSAGRERLGRLSFSLFEELRQRSSALSWAQAEAAELRQQLRQERQHAQLAIQLPEVVQGIAHDFSNLLETVSAAASVLRTNPAQPAPYRAAMDAALAQIGTLLETLQNWTTWEEKGADREPIQLSTVVEDVLEAALLPMRAPHIRVWVRVQGLPLIRSNRSLLFRSLSNLVWNAVQSMPEGGVLSILGYVQDKRVLLEISDSGGGISEENEEKIFSPHFTTKQGHRGMGLFVVRSLVRRSGADLSFRRRPGGGSTFVLSFFPADAEPRRPRSHVRRRGIATG
jgi:signal transduction histidine kinase